MANMSGVIAVSGFGLNLSGMCVEVLRGVCLLSQGEKVISYQTHPNKFYINRELPTQKTEEFVLAIGKTRNFDGEAVLGLFSEKAVPYNWTKLKKITVPMGSFDLSDAFVTTIFNREKLRVYNYFPNQPDGNTKHFLVPAFVKAESTKFVLDGEEISFTIASATEAFSILELSAAPNANSWVCIDFDIFLK
jgi:hypothetical protein